MTDPQRIRAPIEARNEKIFAAIRIGNSPDDIVDPRKVVDVKKLDAVRPTISRAILMQNVLQYCWLLRQWELTACPKSSAKLESAMRRFDVVFQKYGL